MSFSTLPQCQDSASEKERRCPLHAAYIQVQETAARGNTQRNQCEA